MNEQSFVWVMVGAAAILLVISFVAGYIYRCFDRWVPSPHLPQHESPSPSANSSSNDLYSQDIKLIYQNLKQNIEMIYQKLKAATFQQKVVLAYLLLVLLGSIYVPCDRPSNKIYYKHILLWNITYYNMSIDGILLLIEFVALTVVAGIALLLETILRRSS